MKAASLGDLRHGKIRLKKQELCVRKTHRDQVFGRCSIGYFFKDFKEVAGAEGDLLRHLLNRNIPMKIFLNILTGLVQKSTLGAVFPFVIEALEDIGKNQKKTTNSAVCHFLPWS